jgi:hypothetical protein
MFRFLILALTVSIIPDIFDIAASERGCVCSNGPWPRWLRLPQGGADPIHEEAF